VIDENMCEASQQIVVDDLPGPVAALENQINIDCNTPSGTISLTATSGTAPYQYSIDGINYQDDNSFSGLAVGNYTFSVRDANNCTDEINLEVSANLYELIDSISPQPSACGQAIGSITVFSSANGVTYSLDGGDYQTSNVFNNVAAGNHTIAVIDENMCEASQQITVDDLPPPVIMLADQINIDCNTPAGTVVVSASSGTGTYTYSIDGVNFQEAASFSDLPAGNVTVTVRDENNCTDVLNTEITANLYELIDSIETEPSACGQAIGSIIVNSSASGVQYSLDGAAFQTSNVFTNVAAGSHTIAVIDENNCEATQEVSVSDLDGPSISLDNQVNIDCNTPAGSIAVSATSGTGAYEYSIDGINFQTEANFTDLPTGTYTISVRDENGCIDALTTEITANLYELIDSIDISPSACNQSIGSITVNSSASGMQYSLNEGPFQTSNVFTDLAAGSYTIDVIDEFGCEDTRMVSVNDLDGPSIALENATDIDCTTPSGSITVSVSAGTGPFEYSIDGTNYQFSDTFTELAEGSYTVSVRDANACMDLLMVDINNLIPQLIEDVQTVATTCGNADGAIVVISNETGLQYGLNGANFQNDAEFVNLPAGTYTVNVSNDAGCAEDMEVSVAASDPIAIPEVMVTPTSCGDDNGIIRLNYDGPQQLQYSIGNLPFQAITQVEGLAAGEYPIAVINEEDCEGMTSASIAPSTPLMIEEVKVTRSSCGADDGEIEILTNRPAGSVSFLVNGLAGGNNLVGLAADRYEITAIDADNCTETTSVEVGVEQCEIYIPSAFSPNGDGANDFFGFAIPRNLKVTIESFAVYDRWGEPVYESYPQGEVVDHTEIKWDGYYRGQPASIGVYVYALVYYDEKGYKQVLAGDVMLMR
ncbi:MAG: hypothetical protein D6772_12060, partial [Bacteroidetes bacterium]